MTMSSQIIEVLNHLCLKFGLVIDWTQENIFPYLQELAGKYISWEIATSKAWIIVAVVALIIGLILFISDAALDWAYGIGIAVGVILIIIAVSVSVTQIFDILTCKYFPEKQIVEYINYLMQTKG